MNGSPQQRVVSPHRLASGLTRASPVAVADARAQGLSPVLGHMRTEQGLSQVLLQLQVETERRLEAERRCMKYQREVDRQRFGFDAELRLMADECQAACEHAATMKRSEQASVAVPKALEKDLREENGRLKAECTYLRWECSAERRRFDCEYEHLETMSANRAAAELRTSQSQYGRVCNELEEAQAANASLERNRWEETLIATKALAELRALQSQHHHVSAELEEAQMESNACPSHAGERSSHLPLPLMQFRGLPVVANGALAHNVSCSAAISACLPSSQEPSVQHNQHHRVTFATVCRQGTIPVASLTDFQQSYRPGGVGLQDAAVGDDVSHGRRETLNDHLPGFYTNGLASSCLQMPTRHSVLRSHHRRSTCVSELWQDEAMDKYEDEEF